MPFRLAVKAAPVHEQLEQALELAKSTGIDAIEIQQLSSYEGFPVVYRDQKLRAALVADMCKDYCVEPVVVHAPADFRGDPYMADLSFASEKIVDDYKKAIDEAAEIGILTGTTPMFNFHVFGIMDNDELYRLLDTPQILRDVQKGMLDRGAVNIRKLREHVAGAIPLVIENNTDFYADGIAHL
ncbi:MAG: hypothetical protein ABIG30_00160, partial [Candidatus Aenigmatarchaeota archaeon]